MVDRDISITNHSTVDITTTVNIVIASEVIIRKVIESIGSLEVISSQLSALEARCRYDS